MPIYDFSLIATGLDPEAEDFEDRFFEAGCGDATISIMRGCIILDFAREAKSFAHAVVAAIHDVRSAGAAVVRVEPDPTVSVSEIARRASVGRQLVSLYAKGERGQDFPRPVQRIASGAPLWDWEHVARWFYRYRGHRVMLSQIVSTRVVKAVNRAIEGGNPTRSIERPLYQAGALAKSDEGRSAARTY